MLKSIQYIFLGSMILWSCKEKKISPQVPLSKYYFETEIKGKIWKGQKMQAYYQGDTSEINLEADLLTTSGNTAEFISFYHLKKNQDTLVLGRNDGDPWTSPNRVAYGGAGLNYSISEYDYNEGTNGRIIITKWTASEIEGNFDLTLGRYDTSLIHLTKGKFYVPIKY